MADSETKKFKLEKIDQIGIVVKDCKKVAETWERMFGICLGKKSDLTPVAV